MIVVIADDLTGAAEIGGIGLAYGLKKVELQRQFCSESDARLLIIDTDTRSFSPREAQQVIRGITWRLNESNLPIEWIYKKTDSVLRGPVASELEALRDVMGVARVLLVPANPSKGRVVSNGNYLINGKLLSETDFANDPEYPAITSNVLKFPALSSSDQIHLLKSDQPFPSEGIVIGQAETTDDLRVWAERLDQHTIPAGAGDFFSAILQLKGFYTDPSTGHQISQIRQPALFVLGSGSAYSRETFREAQRMGQAVCRMPDEIFTSAYALDRLVYQWSDEVAATFKKNGCVIVAIDRPVVSNAELARELSAVMSTMIQQVFTRIAIREFYIEGGATASAIVRQLGWKRFYISGWLAAGVVQMRVAEKEECYLTVKPGSYPWPERIRNVFLKGKSRAN